MRALESSIAVEGLNRVWLTRGKRYHQAHNVSFTKGGRKKSTSIVKVAANKVLLRGLMTLKTKGSGAREADPHLLCERNAP
mmetsp:Transcript_539/g.1005  ORF Transcript_539/g.1005 Transcript_539/m.1005 type:complete len:81 (-) Transcript_539:624-866(-)